MKEGWRCGGRGKEGWKGWRWGGGMEDECIGTELTNVQVVWYLLTKIPPHRYA